MISTGTLTDWLTGINSPNSGGTPIRGENCSGDEETKTYRAQHTDRAIRRTTASTMGYDKWWRRGITPVSHRPRLERQNSWRLENLVFTCCPVRSFVGSFLLLLDLFRSVVHFLSASQALKRPARSQVKQLGRGAQLGSLQARVTIFALNENCAFLKLCEKVLNCTLSLIWRS